MADAAGHAAFALKAVSYAPALAEAITYFENGQGPSPGVLQQHALLARASELRASPVATNVADITKWLALLRDCDLWHAPICTGIWTERDGLSLEQANAYLDQHGRFNSEKEFGSIITRHAVAGLWNGRIGDGEHELDWPNNFLHFLTFVPHKLKAHDPDFGSDQCSTERMIEVSFARVIEAPSGRPPVGERAICVGVAPLLTELNHITIPVQHGKEGRSWYYIQSLVTEDIIEKSMMALASKGIEILIIPECAVDSRHLPFIKKVLERLSSQTPISLSIIGIATSPAHEVGFAQNQAVILDRYGNEVCRNDKLIRWNLSQTQRHDYDFEEPHHDAAFLYENILAGDNITVLETPSLGRFMTLICADLIALLPSEWMRTHLCLDWTFIPLFDSSLEDRRWMGIEAQRAAKSSQSRVIVANSIVLQKRYRTRYSTASSECGVLLMVDGVRTFSTRVGRLSCSDSPGITLVCSWPVDIG